jgi:Zn-finger protein
MLAAEQTVSQYFTLDAACYYPCLATGAGNCEEICQIPAYSVTGTGSGTSQTKTGTPKSASTQLIPGVDNKYLLLAAGIIAVVLIVR